jgi:hypothetical protein
MDEPSETFLAAADWLSTSPAAAKLTNEAKLELYGLYKIATVGQPSVTSHRSLAADPSLTRTGTGRDLRSSIRPRERSTTPGPSSTRYTLRRKMPLSGI